ncbi:hypothetical protein HOF65_01140 [bacterium]|jgi:hypothetical protein|nr:hypothetical protein [bacterium]MBT3852643.1 hypothetical protein [bacterium]MBT4633405.1 hypothetical protein [bacterium]MBT5492708.1 hypothetical protein [bacterium]MBT6778828.1 hypothetical protein [bacterium]
MISTTIHTINGNKIWIIVKKGSVNIISTLARETFADIFQAYLEYFFSLS